MQIQESMKGGGGGGSVRIQGVGGLAAEKFEIFHATRELLLQSEA